MMAPFNLIVHGQSEETTGRLVGQDTTGQSRYESEVFQPVAGGFRLIAAAWLVRCFRQAETVLDVRVGLALHELHERLDMDRRRLKADGKRLPPGLRPFSVERIARAVQAPEKRVRSSLRRLNAAKLVSWAEDGKDVSFPLLELEGEDLRAFLKVPVKRRGRIPVPRRMLRWLAKNGTRGTIASALAHCVRCLYVNPRKNSAGSGRCPTSFVTAVFGVTRRTAMAGRAELVRIGWLQGDNVTLKGKPAIVMRKHGREARIALDWTQNDHPHRASVSAPSGTDFAPLIESPKSPVPEAPKAGGTSFAPLRNRFCPPHPNSPSLLKTGERKTIPTGADRKPPSANDGLNGVDIPGRPGDEKAPSTRKADRYEPTPAPFGPPVQPDPRDEPATTSVSSTFRSDLEEPPTLKKPLGHVSPENLSSPDAIAELLARTQRDGWTKKSESAEIDFYSKASHAKRVGRVPSSLMSSMIRHPGQKVSISDEDDDAGTQARKQAKYGQAVHREATKLLADLSDDARFVQEVILALERRGRRVPEGMGLFFQIARLSKGKDWSPQRFEKAKADLEFATAMDASTSAVSTVLEHTETPFVNTLDGGGERTTVTETLEVTTA